MDLRNRYESSKHFHHTLEQSRFDDEFLLESNELQTRSYRWRIIILDIGYDNYNGSAWLFPGCSREQDGISGQNKVKTNYNLIYIFEVNSMSEEIDSEEVYSAEQQSQEQNSVSKKAKKNNVKNKGKIVLNISDCQYPVVSRVAKGFKWKLQSNAEATDWDVFWTDNAVQPETLLKMQPFQKINHFPGMFNLARKNLMGRYLMKMRKKFPDDYSFFPMTWMLPVEYHELKTYFETKPKGKARTFIVKPEALSQGKGIFLTRKLQQIDQNAHCVVQRYMHRPYLIEGLKFDLRVYVLVASVDPLRLYIYHQGLTRFATEKYEPPTKDNMEDVCMHLTNYAINKDNPKFVFNSSSTDMSKGHKRSLTWLYQYLQKNEPKGAHLKQQIQDMIVKTMISGLPVITNTYRSCQPENYSSNMCFELLGFDVMLTDKCEPVLLEINHTPSFTTDTPLDDHIKTNYIRDSLVLMNINMKTKENIIKERREACQQRVITGKKVKLTNEEKELERKKAHMDREKYQSKHIGGFKKIYPLDDEERMVQYEEFLNFSHQSYLISTGTKKGQPMNKKTEKIQSAFGTCFKPKETSKTTTSTKNRQTVPQIPKKTIHYQRKYETKKIISSTSPEIQKKKLTHSENLISPKSLGETEETYQLKLLKRASANNEIQEQEIYIEQQQQQQSREILNRSSNRVKGQNLRSNSTAKQFASLKYKLGSSTYSHLLSHKPSQTQNQFAETIVEQVDQSTKLEPCKKQESAGTLCIGTNKVEDPKSKKIKTNSNNRLDSTPKEREANSKNMNNVQIFFDAQAYPPTYSSKRTPQTLSNNNNQNTGRKNELKLGIFGINQITCQNDRKKYKTPINPTAANPKSMSNIQNWESRGKDRHLSNREKIPILLNTLLIGSEATKPAVSANNLRKILNNVSK